MAHPIATIHYAECVYSMFNPKEHLQTNFWKRDFWSVKDIKDFFAGNPERPKSYIKNVPRKVTWTVWPKDDLHDVQNAKPYEATVYDYKDAERVIKSIVATWPDRAC